MTRTLDIANQFLDVPPTAWDEDTIDKLRLLCCDLVATERKAIQDLYQDPLGGLVPHNLIRLNLARTRNLLPAVQKMARVVEAHLILKRFGRSA